jgi:hypothetical protein
MSQVAINQNVSQILAETKANEAASPKGGKGNGAPIENVMALAYYYLVQAASTTSESALVLAKQSQANYLAQEQLNNQSASLKWYSVPKLKEHTKNVKITHYTWDFWKHKGYFKYTVYKKEHIPLNQSKITNAQDKNQNVQAERQILTEKMGVLQQTASVNETQINTVSDESTQSMQESSQMTQIIQSLTFAALLRQQPQS